MLVIIITIVSLAGAIYILRRSVKDADESPEITKMYDDLTFRDFPKK